MDCIAFRSQKGIFESKVLGNITDCEVAMFEDRFDGSLAASPCKSLTSRGMPAC